MPNCWHRLTLPLAFGLGLVLALLFIEWLPENLLRSGVFEGPFYRPDPLTGVRLQAGTLTLSRLYGYRAAAEIGRDGFRTRLPLDAPAPVPIRVLIVGPSLPFSAGCAEEQALHTRLRLALRHRHGLDAAVYNLAQPNQPTGVSLALLRRYAPRIDPTHVYFWGGAEATADASAGYIARMDRGWAHGYFSPAWITAFGLKDSWLVEHSRLIRLFATREFWRQVKNGVAHAVFPPAGAMPAPPVEASASAPSRADVLADMARETQASGRVFIYSTGLPLPIYQFPGDGHMSPRGIDLLAGRLAERIAATRPVSGVVRVPPAQVELAPPDLLGQPEKAP